MLFAILEGITRYGARHLPAPVLVVIGLLLFWEKPGLAEFQQHARKWFTYTRLTFDTILTSDLNNSLHEYMLRSQPICWLYMKSTGLPLKSCSIKA